MRRRFMSTLAAVLLSGGGHAQEAAISIEAPAGAASGPQRARSELGSSAAVDTAAAIWAVAVDSGRLMIRRSQGPGLGWSEPVPLTPPGEAVEADGDSRPMVAAGTAGEIYVTWTRTLGKPDTGEIRFSRSLDHGRTFSAPVTVHRDREVIAHRFNAIGVSRL
ncbi:MAG: sialidase family protein, partial [Betaproteobacteria bacterium]